MTRVTTLLRIFLFASSVNSIPAEFPVAEAWLLPTESIVQLYTLNFLVEVLPISCIPINTPPVLVEKQSNMIVFSITTPTAPAVDGFILNISILLK